MTWSIDASEAGAPEGLCGAGGVAGGGAEVVATGGAAAGRDGSASPPTDWEQPATRALTTIRPAIRIGQG
jgi:hypothetical protein